jgi:hypothetical protein
MLSSLGVLKLVLYMREFDELFLVKWILYVYSIVIIQVFGVSVYVPILVR